MTPGRRLSSRSIPVVRISVIVFFVLFAIGRAASVKDFGAKGDGVADDSGAISKAVFGATDGVVEFPRGTYRISRTIEIVLRETGAVGLTGRGGSAKIVMAGAITVTESREIMIAGCQVVNPTFRGIHLDRALNSRVTDWVVSEEDSQARMMAAIELTGACHGTIVRGNSVGRGRNGDVVNGAVGVTVNANTSLVSAAGP